MDGAGYWQDDEFNMESLLLADSNDDSNVPAKHAGDGNASYGLGAAKQRISSEPSNINSTGRWAQKCAQSLNQSCGLRIGAEPVDTGTTKINPEKCGSTLSIDTALDLNLDDFIIWPESVEGEVTEKVGSQAPSKREVTPRHPPQSVKVLDEWLKVHIDRPYASREEIDVLADATKLSPLQTFAFNPSHESQLGSDKPLPRTLSERWGQDVAETSAMNTSQMDIPTLSKTTSSPMERFLSTSPEEEGIAESTLKAAAASFHGGSRETINRHGTEALSTKKSQVTPSQSPETSSVNDSGRSSRSESGSSRGSVDMANQRGPRKGRKRVWPAKEESVVRKRKKPAEKYQCTFCARDFGQKFDWQRHEESVHMPQTEWVCMLRGPTIESNPGLGMLCAFCDLPWTSAHLDEHNCRACLSAEEPERAFTRKDKLFQHVKQVHKLATVSAHVQEWSRPIQRNMIMCCGLCGLTLDTWNSRVQHIAQHFCDGQDMQFWMGPPGGILDASSGATGLVDFIIKTKRHPSAETVLEPRQCFFTDQQTGARCEFRVSHRLEAVLHSRQAHGRYKLTSESLDAGELLQRRMNNRLKKGSF